MPLFFLFLVVALGPESVRAEFDRLSVTNAILGQQSQIRGIKEDIAQREIAITRLEQHAAAEAAARRDFDTVLADLSTAKAKLQSIDGNNKKKVIIKLLFETVGSISDSVNLAKGATTSLINKGVAITSKGLVSDKLQELSAEEFQRAMGIHPDQLNEPRTVKIDACSNLASVELAELRQLQRSMSLSLDAMKGIIMNDTGLEEVSDTLAVLKKNEFVREKIDEATFSVGTLKSASEAASGELGEIPTIRGEIANLNSDLSEAEAELETLNQQLKELEAAELLAATEEEYREYEAGPPLDATVPADPPEDYEERLQAARVAEAIARWDAEGVPKMQEIESLKSEIETAWGNLTVTQETHVDPAAPEEFISTILGKGPEAIVTLISLDASASASASNDERLGLIETALGQLPDLLSFTETLRDVFISLQEEQTRLQEVYDVVGDLAKADMGDAMSPPNGVSLDTVTDSEAKYLAWQDLLPAAIAAATEQVGELTEAYGASLEPSTELFNEIKEELDEEEDGDPGTGSVPGTPAAFQNMVGIAASYQALMVANPLMAPVPNPSLGQASPGRFILGYWSAIPDPRNYHVGFHRVLDRHFSATWYAENLAIKLQDADLASANAFEGRYQSVVQTSNTLCGNYMEARSKLIGSYDHLKPFSENGSIGLANEFLAVTSAPGDFPTPPDPGDVNTRFKLLDELFTVDFTTSFNGSAWTGGPGEISVENRGLPQLQLLPFFEVDESARTLTVHRILEIRRVLADGAWRNLPLAEFNTMFLAYQDDLILFSSNPELELRKDFPILLGTLSPTFVSAVSQSANMAGNELQNALMEYHTAIQAPTINGHSGNTSVSILEGQTTPVTLEVNASGGGLSYQWFVSLESHGGANHTGYRSVPGGTSPTLIYGMDQGRDFYCYVSNNSGEVLTSPIRVDVSVSPPLELVYESWLAEFLTPAQLADPAFTEMAASPAGDGVMNLLKFALGLDPTAAAKGEEILQLNTQTPDTMTLSFVLAQDARNAGVTVDLVQSTRLNLNGPWNPVSVVEETISDEIFVSATIGVNGGGRNFFRLEVNR